MRIWEMDPDDLPEAIAARMDRLHRQPAHDHDERRSPFEQDRDRILYSAAFRRLGGVTQIATAREGHVFHNRLTHTVKVAQVGHRLAQYLIRDYEDRHGEGAGVDEIGHLNPDVVETACLAHDLGHPPFGHVAEKALDDLITDPEGPYGLEDGFEGNPQSFRILTRVAVKSGVARGLDLTRASLNAVLKYPWSRGDGGDPPRGPSAVDSAKKWGHFSQDEGEFDFARAHMPEGSEYPSLEAQVMDWADEVTYAVHDVDDFYRAGFIPLDQIVQETRERKQFLEHPRVQALFDHGGFGEDDAKTFFNHLDARGTYYPPSLKVRFTGTREQRCDLQQFSSFLLTRFLTVGPEGPEVGHLELDFSGRSPVLVKDEALAFEVKLLKRLAEVYVFGASPLLAQQEGQKRIVTQLFQAFHEATGAKPSARGLLPWQFRDMLEAFEAEDPEEERLRVARVRIAADVVASLNEDQAINLYGSLAGVSPSSLQSAALR